MSNSKPKKLPAKLENNPLHPKFNKPKSISRNTQPIQLPKQRLKPSKFEEDALFWKKYVHDLPKSRYLLLI